MKRLLGVCLPLLSFTIWTLPARAIVVQQDLDAKITSADGIFAGLAGETVSVRVFYDTDLVEQTPGTPTADTFSSFIPPSNGAFSLGVEIEVDGIVRSTVAPGIAEHDIDVLDTAQLDQWNIDTTNVLSPISQASITLRGNTDFVLPGDGGLTGTPIFPPDYCAAADAAAPLAIGNFTAFAGGQLEGSLIYDFLQGPSCSGPVALCGDANGDGSVNATDALIILNFAVGLGSCEICICDADGSGSVKATDAILVLKAAVGQPELLNCAAC